MRPASRVLSVLFGLLVPLGLIEAASASENYGPSVATEVDLSVTACHDGNPVEVVVSAAANRSSTASATGSTTTVKGRVSLSIIRIGGAVVYEKAFAYAGGERSVTGPVIDRPGDYRVRAVFVPKSDEYLGSRASADFEVPKERCPDGVVNVNDTDGLPDTGGPSHWLLLAGLTLVVGGSGAALRSRRSVTESPTRP